MPVSVHRCRALARLGRGLCLAGFLGPVGIALAAPPPAQTISTAPVALNPAERAWLDEHPVLVVGSAAGGWPPYETNVDGHLGGLSHDFLQQVAARLRVQLQSRTYPSWPALFEAACRGEVDVIMNVSITATRTRCLSFTRPYQVVRPALVGRRDQAERLLSAPPGLRIAVETGHLPEETVPQSYPTARTLDVPDLQAALDAVEARQADAYLGDPFVVAAALRDGKHADVAILGPARLPPNLLHFATPNDRGVLATALDRALSDLPPAQRAGIQARWLDSTLAWATAAPLLSEQERQWLAALPVLRVAFDPTWAPLTLRGSEGEMSGILGDYLQHMQEQLGLRLEVVPAADWRQARALVAAGKADIAPAVDNAGYGAAWHLTAPLVTFPCVIVTARGSDTVAGLDDLAGKRIAISDPDLGQLIAQRLPHAARIDVTGDDDGLQLVAHGGADAYVGNLATVDNALRDYRYRNLHVAAPAGFPDRVGLAVRSPYEQLVPLLDRVAGDMGEQARQQIRKRWLKVDYDYGFARPVVLWSSAAALAIIGLLVAAYLRLRAEIARRREVDTRLREISRNLPAVVFKLRRSEAGEYAFTYVTGNPKPLFDLESEQILADVHALFQQVAEADRPALLEALEASAREFKPLHHEFHAHGAAGLRWISLSGVPRKVEDGAVHWSGYWVDSTTLHEQNEALEQARAEAVAAARAKANFLAVMSHEIRTPMAGLSGLLELLGRTSLQPSQRQLLGTSVESATALRQILDDVLDYSKSEAGEMRLESIDVDLRQIACAVLEVLAPQAREKGLALRLSLAPTLAALHRGDPFRLRQVLLNLVGNAVKFTSTGHVSLVIDVAGAMPRVGQPQHVQLCVADTGVGISPEQQATLFTPFVQADATTTRRYGGTGLGLSICRQLVTLMGGDMSLQSEPGVGTRLSVSLALPVQHVPLRDPRLVGHLVQLRIEAPALHDAVQEWLAAWGVDTAIPAGVHADAWITDTLPQVPDATEAAQTLVLQPMTTRVPAPFLHVASDPLLPAALQRGLHAVLQAPAAEPPAPAAARGAQRPILVAEDHPTNRMLIAMQLDELGYSHVIAEDGAAALGMLERVGPALLLTDISMPNMDGYTLARRIRERERDSGRGRLPIIAMTANVLPAEDMDDGSADLDAQIHKPAGLEELARVLAQWLPKDPDARAQTLQLRQRMGAHMQPLLRTFLDSTHADLIEVRAALARDEPGEVARRLHRIAGALGYLGYGELALAGRDLSHAVEQDTLAPHRDDCASYLRALEELCTELEPLVTAPAPD